MREERPIVFTLSPKDNGTYWIRTNDSRVDKEIDNGDYSGDIVSIMITLATKYNRQSYAVLFEVD